MMNVCVSFLVCDLSLLQRWKSNKRILLSMRHHICSITIRYRTKLKQSRENWRWSVFVHTYSHQWYDTIIEMWFLKKNSTRILSIHATSIWFHVHLSSNLWHRTHSATTSCHFDAWKIPLVWHRFDPNLLSYYIFLFPITHE